MIRSIFLALVVTGSLIFNLTANDIQSPNEDISTSIIGANLKDTKWQGILDLGSMKLTLEFGISYDQKNNSHSATLACFEQNLFGFPVTETLIKNNTVSFDVAPLGMTFEGSLKEDQNLISGTFKQNGLTLPLQLKQIKDDTTSQSSSLLRPQEPKAPYSYIEEEVTCTNTRSGTQIAGTLTLPKSSIPSQAVILIAGSGPMDRNESCFGHKPFLVLADHLTKQGIAVLRFDKRGVGSSTGTFESSTLKDFAEDVHVCIEYLKTRKEINPNQIGLIGHSEGGVVGPMVAADSEDISLLVLLGAPAVPLEEILYEQGSAIALAEGIPQEKIEMNSRLQKEFFSIIKREPRLKIAEKKLDKVAANYLKTLSSAQRPATKKALKDQIEKFNTKGFRMQLQYDPSTSLSQLSIPLLALYGELDLQVSAKQNQPVMEKLLTDSEHQDFQTANLASLNHLLQTAKTGAVSEYIKIEETIAPEVLSTISDWILKQKI